jgi:hypothetical protein
MRFFWINIFMSNKFTNFLGGVAPGLTQGGNLKDYSHASKLYTPNNYGFTPKSKWLYYVTFNINQDALQNAFDKSWVEKQRRNVNVLVKKIDLPKFKIHTESLNQYNRKTVIQTKIDYEPITVLFHDDMSNITTDLWKVYYQYYYADGLNYGFASSITGGPAAYKNNKYESVELGKRFYGLNNIYDTKEPFFNSIDIYQLNRQQFTKITLVNPLVTAWTHGSQDQTSVNDLLENTMTLSYESVLYDTDLKKNRITKDNPGFAERHYDNSPSPLSIGGNGSNSVFGIGGVIPGANEIFGDIANAKSPQDLLRIGFKGRNLIRNIDKIDRTAITEEATSILGSIFRDSTKADAIASQSARALGNVAGVIQPIATGIANSITNPVGFVVPGSVQGTGTPIAAAFASATQSIAANTQ